MPPNLGSNAEPVPERPDRDQVPLPSGRPPPATWRPLEAVPIALIALFVTALLALVVAVIYPPSQTGRVSASTADPRFYAITAVIQGLALFGTVLVWIRYVNKGSLASLGLPRNPSADLAAGIAVGLALEVLGLAALVLLQHLAQVFVGHQPTPPDQIPTNVSGWPFALTGAYAIVLAPLAEETFFRGFLYRGLRRRYSVWPAALISAFFFGLVHIQGVSYLLLVPPLFVVGLGLALVYERRQSLLASMAAHATFNVIGVVSIIVSRR